MQANVKTNKCHKRKELQLNLQESNQKKKFPFSPQLLGTASLTWIVKAIYIWSIKVVGEWDSIGPILQKVLFTILVSEQLLFASAISEFASESNWVLLFTMEKACKPFGYWRKRDNQVQFLDEFAKKYGIKRQQDWGNVGLPSIKKHGGAALLRIYRNNLLRTLERVYPRT